MAFDRLIENISKKTQNPSVVGLDQSLTMFLNTSGKEVQKYGKTLKGAAKAMGVQQDYNRRDTISACYQATGCIL